MKNKYTIAATILFCIFNLQSVAQYPWPSVVFNGKESELLARAGNRLVFYDAYARNFYGSDGVTATLIHNFLPGGNNEPDLNDYEEASGLIYISGVLDASIDKHLIYRSDGYTLDTLFMSTYPPSVSFAAPKKIMALHNDTLYFWNRDTLYRATPAGVVTSLGPINPTNYLTTWNKYIVIYENIIPRRLRIFNTQTQTTVWNINLVSPSPLFYHKQSPNDYLFFCDNALKYMDPVTFSVTTLDASLTYEGILGFKNNKVICFASDAAGLVGTELYSVDITTHAVTLIKDINPGAGHGCDYTTASYAISTTNYIYFYANDGVQGTEMWITDGTAAGTHIVSNYCPGNAGLAFHHHASGKPEFRTRNFAYVVGDTVITGLEPFSANGCRLNVTNGNLLYGIDLFPSNNDEQTYFFTELNGYVYYTTEVTPSPWGHLCRFNPWQLTSMEEIKSTNDMYVFPNPVQGIATIKLNQPLQNGTLCIYSLSGELIKTISSISGKEITFEIASIAKGVYIAELKDDNKISRMKIMKD